jgi:peptidoglycan/xylan/chitin deacetylase (PgdA/CDA1 family)
LEYNLKSYYFHHFEKKNKFGVYSDNSIKKNDFEHFVISNIKDSEFIDINNLLSHQSELRNFEYKYILLTFDDGYSDNLFTLLPILEKYNIKATIFITIGFILREFYPFEYILSDIISNLDNIDINEKTKIYHNLKRKLKYLTYHQKVNLLESEFNKIDINKHIHNDLFLDRNQLIELSQSELISIGCHSYTHDSLLYTNKKDSFTLLKECYQSKVKLESLINKEVNFFSYPYGEYNRDTITAMKDFGYHASFTTNNPKSLAEPNFEHKRNSLK